MSSISSSKKVHFLNELNSLRPRIISQYMVDAIVESITAKDRVCVLSIILGCCTQSRYLRAIEATFPLLRANQSSRAGHITNVPVSSNHHRDPLSNNPAPMLAMPVLSASSGSPMSDKHKKPKVLSGSKEVAEPPRLGIINEDCNDTRNVDAVINISLGTV